MITLKSFYDTYQHYQSNLIHFRLLQEQAFTMLCICNPSNPLPTNPLEITHEDIEWLLQQPQASTDYTTLVGGHAFVCEFESDLQQIKGCDFEWAASHSSEWPNVTECVMSWDCCCYLQESSCDPQWVMFLMCWNNAGGPVYYVPKHLWHQARVTEHIAATAFI